MSGHGGKKVLLPPINFIFSLLQRRARIQVWLSEQFGIRLEGTMRGFDEFMNIVLEDAVEVKLRPKEGEAPRRNLGTLLLKGDNVALIQSMNG